MSSPVRVQLSRKKGWKMPPNTKVVSRPSVHGNPFKVVRWGKKWSVLEYFRLGDTTTIVSGMTKFFETAAEARAYSVELYKAARSDGRIDTPVDDLRDKNLACWCPLDQPCHADVLLDLANTWFYVERQAVTA